MKPPNGADVLRTPVSACLNCGARMDAIGTANPEKPAEINPGDVALTVCIKCGAVMMLDEHLKPRGMSQEEIDALVADPVTMNALAFMVKNVYLFRAMKS